MRSYSSSVYPFPRRCPIRSRWSVGRIGCVLPPMGMVVVLLLLLVPAYYPCVSTSVVQWTPGHRPYGSRVHDIRVRVVPVPVQRAVPAPAGVPVPAPVPTAHGDARVLLHQLAKPPKNLVNKVTPLFPPPPSTPVMVMLRRTSKYAYPNVPGGYGPSPLPVHHPRVPIRFPPRTTRGSCYE